MNITMNAYALLPNWKLTSDVDGLKVWLYTPNSAITGSSENRKLSSKIDWSKIKEQEYFKKFEDQKKGMLSLMGISNWKVFRILWTAHKGHYQLDIEGNYTNSSHQEISFVEQHLYYSDRTIQFLHTRPKSVENGDVFAKEILNYMRVEAGIAHD